jgi:regulatory protein
VTGRITAIRVDRRDPGRLQVFLDGRPAFTATLLEGARLAEGQTLSAAEIRRWCRADQERQALAGAVGLLARRPHSRREIERRLRQRRFPRDVVAATLDRLEERGYLDDGAFARQWVAQRMRQSPRSARALAYELKERGVGEEDVQAALQQADDAALARACLARRRRAWEGLALEDRRRKILTLLQGKGFSYETAREVAADPEGAEEGRERD